MSNTSDVTITTGLHAKLENLRQGLLAAQPHDFEYVYDTLLSIMEALIEAEVSKAMTYNPQI